MDEEKYKELEAKAKELYRALDLMLQAFWPNENDELIYLRQKTQSFGFIALNRNEDLKPLVKEQKAMNKIFSPLIEIHQKEYEELLKKLKL